MKEKVKKNNALTFPVSESRKCIVECREIVSLVCSYIALCSRSFHSHFLGVGDFSCEPACRREMEKNKVHGDN